VSQVDNNTHSESALSAVASATINAATGGYAGMLHIAGQGTTFSALLKAQGSPNWETRIDANIVDMFGQLAPNVRYGVRYYHMVKLKNFLSGGAADVKALIALFQQAATGLAVYYRDAFGAMFTVAVAEKQALTYKPALYRYVDMDLVQIPDTYTPSVSLGSAQGYRALLTGSLPPLDSSEQVV
jgi:hypothetical protein